MSADPIDILRAAHAEKAESVQERRCPLEIQDLAELIAEVDAAPTPRHLFRPVWPAGDHGMVSAEDKAGKTWLIGDAAVSVASGTPWLSIYDVDAPGPVLLFVGEGGKRKVTVHARRRLSVRSEPIS